MKVRTPHAAEEQRCTHTHTVRIFGMAIRARHANLTTTAPTGGRRVGPGGVNLSRLHAVTIYCILPPGRSQRRLSALSFGRLRQPRRKMVPAALVSRRMRGRCRRRVALLSQHRHVLDVRVDREESVVARRVAPGAATHLWCTTARDTRHVRHARSCYACMAVRVLQYVLSPGARCLWYVRHAGGWYA